MEEKQKKQPAKRIQLVDVVLERKGSQLWIRPKNNGSKSMKN